jgi:hypothetical protein
MTPRDLSCRECGASPGSLCYEHVPTLAGTVWRSRPYYHATRIDDAFALLPVANAADHTGKKP